MVEVEQWAELRRLHFVRGVSIRELQRRSGLGRNTIRRALRADAPPRYERRPAPSKLEPFKPEVKRLLREEPKLPGVRVFEELCELGFEGGKTVVYDYVAELRPLFLPAPRTFQRTSYRPGKILQFDLWTPRHEVPVGHGQTRRGWVVVAALGFSRAGAGTLIFAKEAPDILAGLWRCLERLGALPERLVIDREGALHAGAGRPTPPFAAFCGQLVLDWQFCEPADPQAKGLVERLQGYMQTSFEPGRSFANELDFQDQLDRWFDARGEPAAAPHAAPAPGRSARRRARADAPAAAPARPRAALGAARPARSARPCRHQRLLARPRAGRPPRRGPRLAARGLSGRARHRRARRSPTRAASPSTRRSRRSSTPARCASRAATQASWRSRRGRLTVTTR